MNVEFTFSNVLASAALLISAGSFAVSWMNRRDAARLTRPHLWLTLDKFEDHPEWRWVYVHLDNKSTDWIRLVSVIPKRGTRLHSFQGPMIGGEFWQFPEGVSEDGFCKLLDLSEQEPVAAPGAEASAEFLVKSENGKVRLKLRLRVSNEKPHTKTVDLEAYT